jgi:predicted transcriptional regulator
MSAVRSIRLSEDLQSRMEAFANRHQRTPNFVITEALKDYLETKEQEEVIVAAAKEAWAEFQATGRGVEWDEMREWIASWGSPSEKSVPQCREL